MLSLFLAVAEECGGGKWWRFIVYASAPVCVCWSTINDAFFCCSISSSMISIASVNLLGICGAECREGAIAASFPSTLHSWLVFLFRSSLF